jgi:hypothetical protein
MVDIVPFLLIFYTGIFGFGFFFLTRDPAAFGYDNEVLGIAWPFYSSFLLALGAYDAGAYPDWLSLIVLKVAILFSTVLLLNLLIAIMSDSYGFVKESEVVEKQKAKARLVVEHERLHPRSNRFPRFMHVLRAAEGGEGGEATVWEGIAGKVKKEVASLRSAMDEKHEKLQEQNEKLQEQNKELKVELKAQEKKIEMLLSKVDEVLAATAASRTRPGTT